MRPIDVIWPFRAMCYIGSMRYALQSATREAIIHITGYSGAAPCTPSSLYCTPHPTGSFTCYSAGLPQIACFGYKGSQILDSIGVTYALVSSADKYLENIGYSLVIAACYIVFFFAQVPAWSLPGACLQLACNLPSTYLELIRVLARNLFGFCLELTSRHLLVCAGTYRADNTRGTYHTYHTYHACHAYNALLPLHGLPGTHARDGCQPGAQAARHP